MKAPVSLLYLDRVLRAAEALFDYDMALAGGDHITGVTDWREPGNDAAKRTPFAQAAREIRRMYAERAEAAIAAADARPMAPQHAVQANEAARTQPALTDHVTRIASRSAAARKAAATRKRTAAARARA